MKKKTRKPRATTILSQAVTDLSAKNGVTPAEEQVLKELVLRGNRAPVIATTLGISSFTVNNHVKSIRRKFGAATREQVLVAIAQHAIKSAMKL
ncbi:MAG: LuxR C-terminal-related transcriptional regulator [Myxococcales bacterium]|nr:LuxR C-terminal-related transcriptional regulator [Myxococcales bacterium]